MADFKDILTGAAVVAGGAQLGSMLFPETFGSLFGSSVTPSNSVGNSLKTQAANDKIFGLSPQVASAGILAVTQGLTAAFGSSAEDDRLDFQRENAELTREEQGRQFDENLAFRREQLEQEAALREAALAVQRESIGAQSEAARKGRLLSLLQSQVSSGNQLTNSRLGRGNNIPQLFAQSGQVRSQAAGTSGAQAGNFFNTLAGNLGAAARGA